MPKRSPFPPVFWVANIVEVLERFAYYGIYFGFGIYMAHLGHSTEGLGTIQSLVLFMSYLIPVFSGTLADRYGLKTMLIVSYLAYLPAVLLLLVATDYYPLLFTMASIGFAAGLFKPLVASTVRVTSDSTNKTVGFGIYYAMVNIGGSFGPIISGYLRATSWRHAHLAGAVAIGVMFVITLLFYKEPPREKTPESLGKKLVEIFEVVFTDRKFFTFLLLLGVFFWLPFWAFFNLCALYVDKAVDTVALYNSMSAGLSWIPGLGPWLLGILSHEENGARKVLGESISHTGYIIMILQVPIAWIFERFRAIPSFIFGLGVAGIGLAILGLAVTGSASFVFLGILLFAIGEMISSPRIQEYITWIAPKEKAGLYAGSNFLATMVGGVLSGFVYTSGLYAHFEKTGHPQYVWYVMGAHMALAMVAFWLFVKLAGEFQEQEQ
jgi:MFS family permease